MCFFFRSRFTIVYILSVWSVTCTVAWKGHRYFFICEFFFYPRVLFLSAISFFLSAGSFSVFFMGDLEGTLIFWTSVFFFIRDFFCYLFFLFLSATFFYPRLFLSATYFSNRDFFYLRLFFLSATLFLICGFFHNRLF